MAPKKILIGTDFSDHARAAAQYGLSLAASVGADVVLFYAPSPVEEPFGGAYGYVTEVLDDMVEARDTRTRKALADEVATLIGDGERVEVAGYFGVGPAAAAIAQATTDHRCDLVVVGSHGRTGLKRTLMGSVAERTVRLSSVSVIVVR